jgi:hypothetical protein
MRPKFAHRVFHHLPMKRLFLLHSRRREITPLQMKASNSERYMVIGIRSADAPERQ